MQERFIYIAEDGTEFATKAACQWYEKERSFYREREEIKYRYKKGIDSLLRLIISHGFFSFPKNLEEWKMLRTIIVLLIKNRFGVISILSLFDKGGPSLSTQVDNDLLEEAFTCWWGDNKESLKLLFQDTEK